MRARRAPRAPLARRLQHGVTSPVAIGAAVGVVSAAVIVGPLTGKGWLQLLDWPTGPAWPQEPARWSLSSGPLFALVVTVCRLLTGAAAGWLVPGVALVIAAGGASRLVGERGPACAVCALAFVWNPFVLSRLYSGHVAFLLGYALLPWLAHASWSKALARPIEVAIWWTLAIAASVHLAWIGGVVVAVGIPIAARRVGARAALRLVVVCVLVTAVATAAWVVRPHHGVESGDERVLDAFASRPDDDLGLTLGLAAQQGFWRATPIEPANELGSLFAPLAGALLAVTVLGLAAADRERRVIAAAAATAGLVGLVLAHGAAGPTGELYRDAWRHLPGFAVMREAQKFVALVSLATALGAALLVSAIGARHRARGAWLTAFAVGALVVGFTPTLPGLGGRVEPSRFPASVDEIRAVLDADFADDHVAIALPWTLYSRTIPSDRRFVAAPARALFGTRVLWSDDPGIDGLGEVDARRREIGTIVRSAGGDTRALATALRAHGVRWVVEIVDPVQPGPDLGRADFTLRVSDGAVRLWRVPGI